jgi:cystathionine beta-lyase
MVKRCVNHYRRALALRREINNMDYDILGSLTIGQLRELFAYVHADECVRDVMEWVDEEDLERIGKLCEKYNVLVLSDEIHCDIVKPGLGYIPYASVNECNKMNSITCIAPTKTFNIASLQTSCVFVPNEKIREKMQKGLGCDDNEGGNAFSYTPVIEAYNKCEYWVDEMLEYVWHNRELVKDYIRKEIPEIEYVEGEATYLVWLDCSSVVSDSDDFTNFLNKELKLTFNSGKRYGEQGKHFVRVNIACPECVVLEGLKRLKKGIEIYRK